MEELYEATEGSSCESSTDSTSLMGSLNKFRRDRSATNQERELEMTLGTVMGLFEPIMVVVMGGLVLTIVMAILLPIFDLNTMVR